MMSDLIELSQLGDKTVVGRATELKRQGFSLENIKTIQACVPDLDVEILPRHIGGDLASQAAAAAQLRDQTRKTTVFNYYGNLMIVGQRTTAA